MAPAILIGLAAAALTVSLWAWLNQPQQEPPWPTTIQGFAFSPYRAGQNPAANQYPTDAEIDADLKLLSGKTYAIRTYSVDGTLGDIPRLAAKYHINVALGAWIDKDQKYDAAQVARAIAIAKANPNVVRVMIGNEAVLRGDVSAEELIPYLDEARAEIDQPVSTAEPWYSWIRHPELAKHVDFLGVHMLPYWEGVNVHDAVPYIAARMQDMHRAFPGKPIVIAEVGWPSVGLTRHAAVASTADEALFLRRFLAYAGAQHWTYYLMEAFDQPWKGNAAEGDVGSYWGVYNVYRQPKFTFTRPIVSIPNWRVLAGVSVLVASLLLGLIFLTSRRLKKRGLGFLAVIVYAVSTLIVWIIHDYLHRYLTVSNIAVGILLLLGMIGVILVLLAEAHEWAEAHWVRTRRRLFEPEHLPDDQLPMVSIHVPAYNEPPDMLRATLDALAALDYPRYEVLVIDNNTKDAAVWEPVQAHCEKLGARFHFFHVAPLAGFKAGALNFALRHTDPGAQVIAVIDSDYLVKRGWLRDLLPLFTNEKMAVVQAPQDYRDGELNAFKAMCYAEYRGFFYVGMITRNERNAIIQHGTMTMIRRTVLDQLGWAEWCITEDAELGLRVFEAGLEAAYIPKSYGCGLMPDTFLDYKKQRFRWAYGAVQILKHHARTLFVGNSRLTLGQRYHFLAGWLPWLADGFNLLFNLGAMLWSLVMINFPHEASLPMVVFSVLPLSLFVFRIAKLVFLYRSNVGANLRQTLAAAVAGLALTHTIGLAVMSGFFTRSKPFFRTPKQAQRHALLRALRTCREEVLIMLALWLCAWGVYSEVGLAIQNISVWVVVLLIQSTPYCASLILALISAWPGLPAKLIGRSEDMDVLAQTVLKTEGMGAG
ncbi:MAG: glycosyltransferase [Gammaproteobacteria bacterium]|nr:glycosyltransferase [Gammaproteobacteria bacterium]MBU6510294.1 glycosyltransferase [Gammaproteobacteria bacterium]